VLGRQLFGTVFCESENPLVEVNHLAPVEPGVDPTDLRAGGAFEVRRDVVPVPVGEICEHQPAVMVLAPDAIDEHGIETCAAVDGPDQ
jgi:hypothetical protein